MACDVVQPISSSAALLAPPHRAHTRRTLINCVFLLQEQLPTTARGEQEREELTRICTEKLSDTATIMSQQVIEEQFIADIVSLVSSPCCSCWRSDYRLDANNGVSDEASYLLYAVRRPSLST